MTEILCSTVTQNTVIETGEFGVEKTAELVAEKIRAEKMLIVFDSNLFNLYGKAVKAAFEKYYKIFTAVIKAGESSKNSVNAEYIYNCLFESGFTRSDVIVYVGGGVAGDLTTYVGATFLRGIRVVGIPTSLLAMCDSSVGGKCGIDTVFGKNLIGAIYQPSVVIADTVFLKTLPAKYFSDGMAEVIKYGYIYDRPFLDRLYKGADEKDMVSTSIKHKVRTVMADVTDKGERMKLNFGHTVAHSLEKLGDYTEYGHGEAVAIGMDFALFFSGLSKEDRAFYRELAKKYGLPYSTHYSAEEIVSYVGRDKKVFDGKIHYVALAKAGEAKIVETNEQELLNALKEWTND